MVGGITLVDDALLTIRDGTLAGQHAVIAPATLQTAAGMVVDTGGALNLAGTFTIGKQKPGTLTIQNGGDVESATGVLGESGAGDGSVTVTGNGSTWHNTGSVYVGGQAAIDGGNGTLSIANQGLVDVDGTLKLWPGGNVALDGGTLETEMLELAGGAFNWTSGTLHFSSDLSVEPSGSLGGSVAVGTGKALDADGDLFVGNAGTGALDITGGGDVSNDSAYIGDDAGSMGEVTVDGAGSTWTNSGSLYIGRAGNGTLNITGGGSVQSDFTGVGLLGPGSVSITNAGELLTAEFDIGSSNGSTGSVSVEGAGSILTVMNIVGLLDITSKLRIVRGTLEIEAGGHVDVGLPISGVPVINSVEILSAASVTVDGADSQLNVNIDGDVSELNVFGSLEIRNGGEVKNSEGRIQGGAVSIDGAGSGWLNVEELTISGNGTLTVTNGGTAYATTLTVGALAEIHGDGNIVGNVENSGLVSPGTSPGALSIDGDYTQTAPGELLIELASASSYDQLLVTGDSTLAGTLNVSLIEGFVPSPGQSFTFLTANDIDVLDDVFGVFATEPVSPVPGLIFDVIYNPQSVVLTVLPAFTADFDEDGDVDSDDLTQWHGDFGENALSDADNDGDSDGADFLAWQQQFGGGLSATGSGAAVPEPSSAWLFAAAMLLVGTAHSLRRNRP
jgi:T5SS/PEP-CTERM-associated repeat protein